MDDLTLLKNDCLTVHISSMGAALKSVVDSDGTHRLWYGDEKYWKDTAPLLFPICGCMTDDSYLYNGKSESAPIKDGIMELFDDEFKRLDTSIFKNTLSKRVTLRKKNSKKSVSLEYDGFDNLLLWKEPKAQFLCIEPWCGLPDNLGQIREISEKDGIIKLEKNGVFKRTHTIIIE